jgi:transposase
MCHECVVFRIESEKDIELLRQAALLLQSENQRLTAKLVELTRDLLVAQGKDKQELQLRLAQIEQQLAAQNKKIFGDSSEKRDGDGSRQKAEKKPPKGHGPTAQPKLLEITTVHELDEADKVCRSCGGKLEAFGPGETSDEVGVIERRFYLNKHTQKKYACGCGGCVETAPGPTRLFPGARYSVDVAIEIVVMKYLDHLPLERQVRIFAREGLTVTSQTLWDYLERVARLVEPAYERLHAYVLAQPVIGADETWWRLMGKSGQEKTAKRWHAWAASTASAIYFTIEDSRSAEAACELLAGYAGTVMCDGYAAYESLARANRSLVLAHCWAHVRREFLEVEGAFPAETKAVLGLIRELYAIEARCAAGPPGDALRRTLRDEHSRAIVDRIQAWVYATYPNTLPESGLGKAIRYMGGLWPGLRRFLDDPRIPLDNNGTERGIRGPVLGRKNHYGSRSLRGTEVAALFYSLMESAKLAGVEPKAYLRYAVLSALAGNTIALPHEVAELLPPLPDVATTAPAVS